MYSNFRSVQILIALMKEFGIRHVVLSPGGSDVPIIHSIETDDFFTCYSVVDERSAAYFALGLSQQLNQKVACVCTSGTAVCNYLPGITEAFYQSAPVLAITADKNPYFQGQLETQKINQMNVFAGVVKKDVELPLIRDAADEWLCNRLVNEAMLALTHHGEGPVHINIPIVGSTETYDCTSLPIERKIGIIDAESGVEEWNSASEKLSKSKRILVVVGQNEVFSEQLKKKLELFFAKYNCVYAVENISNLECSGCIHTYPITEMCASSNLETLLPDIVLSIGNNLAAYMLKPFLRKHYRNVENWLISKSGEVRDSYKCLTSIFECSLDYFFERMNNAPFTSEKSGTYFQEWTSVERKIQIPELPFSSMYVASQLSKVIPSGSILHLAILNSTRIMQFFHLANNVRVFSNVGALGIDGCFSTFAGQSAAFTGLSYLLIGDLSFFYDMGAAGLRSIANNVRIILLNNGGGSEFHFFLGKKKIPTINSYICAEHSKTAKGWISSLGYCYYSARTKQELADALDVFSKPSNTPLFLEVFTNMEDDASEIKDVYHENSNENSEDKMKGFIKKMLPTKVIEKLRR